MIPAFVVQRREADPVSWSAILLLAGSGLRVQGHRPGRPRPRRAPRWFAKVTGLLPPALLAALVVVQTFATDTHWSSTPAPAGLAAGIVAVALRAPFLVVVIAAAGVTAALRALT